MRQVLLQALHRPDRSPSQRYRIEQYLPYLQSHGYRFRYSYLLNERDDRAYYKPGQYLRKGWIVGRSTAKRLGEIATATRHDLLFVQRESFMLGTAFFEQAMARRRPLIFDFDDAIWMQLVSAANRNLAFLKDASKTEKIIRSAALVFAGNAYLADYARQFNREVVVIPTTIDTDSYRRVEVARDGRICIGWTGSFSTIEHLKTALPALERIRGRFGDRVTFRIIGDPAFRSEALGVQGIPWQSATETRDLSYIDIGIMPLPDNEWTKGKCGAKGLQYMAMGIATLMSPVGVNTEIIQPGVNGFLPRDEEEWVHYLSLLIEDAELRKRLGEAGRRTVEEKYSVRAWRDHYLNHFNQLTNQRS